MIHDHCYFTHQTRKISELLVSATCGVATHYVDIQYCSNYQQSGRSKHPCTDNILTSTVRVVLLVIPDVHLASFHVLLHDCHS